MNIVKLFYFSRPFDALRTRMLFAIPRFRAENGKKRGILLRH